MLSVLALSSRFDGQATLAAIRAQRADFQYSLCRVVLMVKSECMLCPLQSNFQYSLCRVVLMVTRRAGTSQASHSTFSTRSVESF